MRYKPAVETGTYWRPKVIQILRAVRRQPVFAVVACGYMMGATAARADDWADCQSKTAAQIISGCTSVIQKGGRNVRETAQAYRLRGDSYLQQNRHDQAIADHDQALKLDPNHSWALVGRGTAFSRIGKLDQAFADLNRAIALDPKRAQAYTVRGQAYGQKRDWPKAIADYSTSIDLAPSAAATFGL